MTDATTEYMSAEDFAAKVSWEGGVAGALEYGLKSTALDPNDPASTPLREAWSALETIHRDQWQPAAKKVEDLVDELYEGE